MFIAMNYNYANNSNNGGVVTSSTGLFSMREHPQEQRVVSSSTGIFSKVEDVQPAKLYSSTGLFTTETRTFGKWGKRLLTGAALLGGAALANHLAGDPYGIGAKVGSMAKGAWGAINPNVDAVAKGAAAPIASMQAKKEPSVMEKIGQGVDKFTQGLSLDTIDIKAAYAEKFGDVASKTAAIKTLEAAIPKARATGNQQLADQMYNRMNRLRTQIDAENKKLSKAAEGAAKGGVAIFEAAQKKAQNNAVAEAAIKKGEERRKANQQYAEDNAILQGHAQEFQEIQTQPYSRAAQVKIYNKVSGFIQKCRSNISICRTNQMEQEAKKFESLLKAANNLLTSISNWS